MEKKVLITGSKEKKSTNKKIWVVDFLIYLINYTFMSFKNSTDEKFQEQINGSKLNLIQFSASWCGPCQQLKPIIEKISNDMADKIDCYYHDIESQPNEPTKYSVRGVPTVLLFKGGKLVGTKVGATSEKDMLEFIHPHI